MIYIYIYLSIYVSIYLSVCLSIYLYVLVWWCVISEARSLFRGDVGDVVLNCLDIYIYIYICVCIHIIGTCTVRYNTGWCLLTPMQRSQMAIVVPNIPYMIETFWTRIHIYIIYIYNIIYSYYYHSYYYSYTYIYIYRYICIFKTCRIHQPEHNPCRKKKSYLSSYNPHPNRQKTSKLVARRSWQEKGFLWTISAAAAGQRDFTFGMYQSQNRFTWLHPTQL